ncbi:histidine phosphatase family protein [Bacillus sp. S/N-304-OC-R1]|uniref:histidine phosphatase family protein n=1 Tax=Bacillus sp. S/N-304-OC-R1 TaxID=2758034 RepID=UPI001C8E0B5D|nr:histidine phosphatase family protein [Bacillus sp. S/N-304-OC-R1]MBY0121187.1 histidine phosphatase family protein [Bacillus sp. S/N-304-OC-R1]
MDDAVVIALFRHGLTEANRRREYLGWTDSPLCEDIERVSEEYEVLFSSDLGRCLETAGRMFPDQQLQPLFEFREMNFGEWEGKTYKELQHEPEYRSWISSPLSANPLGGESFKEYSERVDKGWDIVKEKMMNTSLSRAAIITHGGVIRTLLMKWASVEKDFWEWKVPHGQGYELVWNRQDLRRGARCTLLREVPLTANQNG